MKRYTIIKTEGQYNEYCNDLETLTKKYQNKPDGGVLDLIETITLLIERYDQENSFTGDTDPIQLLKYLMEENNLKNKDLVRLLGLSKGHISDILNYKKGLSKMVIRTLSERFKVRQEAFNRSYPLILEKESVS